MKRARPYELEKIHANYFLLRTLSIVVFLFSKVRPRIRLVQILSQKILLPILLVGKLENRKIFLYRCSKPTVANRLSKIVTRREDEGSTGLADGTRGKYCAHIYAIGSVDELTAISVAH